MQICTIIIHYHPLSSILPFYPVIYVYIPFQYPVSLLVEATISRHPEPTNAAKPRHTSPPSTLLALAPPAPAARCRCQRLPRPELCGPPDLKGTKKLEVLMEYSNR
jgi:hypothetical protein